MGPVRETRMQPYEELQSLPEVLLSKRAMKGSMKKNGNWGDLQSRVAMAAIDQGYLV